MRITIFGAGAIGSLIGCMLYQEHELSLVGREKHMSAIQKDGLRISGKMTRECRPRTYTDATDLPTQDLVVLTVKSYQTKEALRSIESIVSDGTNVVAIQNGLTSMELLSDRYGDRGLVGLTSLGATYLGPGKIRFAGMGKTIFGSPRGTTEYPQRVAAIFNSAGLPSRVSQGITSEVWMKAIVNAVINPITALTRSKNGCLTASPLNELARAVTEEAVQVANAHGIDLPCEAPFSRVMEVARNTSDNQSSMLQQVKRGEKTEIEEITGEIVRLGDEKDLHTPLNRAFLNLVRCLSPEG